MSLTESSELAEMLDRVRRWSEADRFALVKGVLETLAPRSVTPSPIPRGRSVEEILETYKTDKPAPNDETVHQWIDEQRMEKYG
jgi:hypothetical protein